MRIWPLVRVDLLNECDHAGRSRRSRVARTLHGRAPCGLGEHVVADGRPVTAVQRFQVEDGVILGPGFRRPDLEVRIAKPSLRGGGIRQSRGGNARRESDALDARISLLKLQPLGERVKIVRRWRVGGPEKACAGPQNGDVGVDAALDGVFELIGCCFESLPVARLGLDGSVGGRPLPWRQGRSEALPRVWRAVAVLSGAGSSW